MCCSLRPLAVQLLSLYKHQHMSMEHVLSCHITTNTLPLGEKKFLWVCHIIGHQLLTKHTTSKDRFILTQKKRIKT